MFKLVNKNNCKESSIYFASEFIQYSVLLYLGLMFAGGGAGFQKQSKPPWETTNANTPPNANNTTEINLNR